MNKLFPNFLMVGSAKSGTTSLYHYLEQHPDVYMTPTKEPLFFCSHGVDKETFRKELYPMDLDHIVTDLDKYHELFANASGQKVRGEASVYYLLDHKKTIANIQALVPDWQDIKIVIILRNPVDACFSHYQMYSQYLKHFRGHDEGLTFEESLAKDDERIQRGYMATAHKHWFMYYEQVKDYMDNFRNVRMYLLSDLKKNPYVLIKDLFTFLEIDNEFVPSLTNQKYNVSGIPKNEFIYKALMAPSPIKTAIKSVLRLFLSRERMDIIKNRLLQSNIEKPAMKAETREMLKASYRDDILKLQSLIGRDLSGWL